MTFPGLLICWHPKIPTATPFGGGGGKFFLSIFSTVHEIYRTLVIVIGLAIDTYQGHASRAITLVTFVDLLPPFSSFLDIYSERPG